MTKQALTEWAQQLGGLLVLGFCAAMSMPGPKPKGNALPFAAAARPAASKPRKKRNPSPQLEEFMRLPPHIQRQVLEYARNWVDANFERTY